ncbi:hypothetical protein ACFX2I_027676 [Malus domestica]
MIDQGKHESSQAPVPLTVSAKSDREQHIINHVHRDSSTDRHDMQKITINQQVNIRGSRRLHCPTRLKSMRKYKGS